jgi:SAM-dependent methyltransferase
MARRRNLPPDRVRFLRSPFEECEADGPFHAVIGSSVLHHLDIEVALKRIFRLLRPGGVMSFAEPNMLNPQVFLERRFRRLFPYVSPDETAFVRFGFARLMKRCGFDQIRILPFDWLHPAVPRPIIPFVMGSGRILETIPVLREFAGSLLITGRCPVAKGA